MSLMRAELRRFGKRRFLVWSLPLIVLLLAGAATIAALTHQKPGPEVVAEAEARAAEEFANQQVWVAEEIERCERDKEAGTDADWWPEDCSAIEDWQPTEEDMVDWYMPPAFDFREQFPIMATVLVGLLGMYAFLAGASFVGAEWRSGAMMNLLLWRPRRLRTLGTKLAALLTALTGIFVGFAALWTGALWLVATTRGVTDTMTVGAWQSFGLTGLRGIGLVLAAGAVGFALASLGRHIAMALGSAIAAFVVGVGGVGIVVALVGVAFPAAWLWTTYLQAWLDGSVVLESWASCEAANWPPNCRPDEFEVTWQTSGLLIAATAVLLLGAAMWQMRRRDIT